MCAVIVTLQVVVGLRSVLQELNVCWSLLESIIVLRESFFVLLLRVVALAETIKNASNGVVNDLGFVEVIDSSLDLAILEL